MRSRGSPAAFSTVSRSLFPHNVVTRDDSVLTGHRVGVGSSPGDSFFMRCVEPGFVFELVKHGLPDRRGTRQVFDVIIFDRLGPRSSHIVDRIDAIARDYSRDRRITTAGRICAARNCEHRDHDCQQESRGDFSIGPAELVQGLLHHGHQV